MSDVIYVQIKSSLITVKNLSNGAYFQDIPQIAVQALGKRKKVVAYGKQANFPYGKPPETIVLNAFHHPRSLINDFEVAEKTLGIFLKQVDRRKIRALPFSPKELIIHPLEKLEGGLTQIESRAFSDLGYRIMAKKALVWTGTILSDAEILFHQFPASGTLFIQ
jgi:rod shape-determining protein MreB and related proteins